MSKEECAKCKSKNVLIFSLFEYVLDDFVDTYDRLKTEYGPNHPEVRSMGELLTRIALVIDRKT